MQYPNKVWRSQRLWVVSVCGLVAIMVIGKFATLITLTAGLACFISVSAFKTARSKYRNALRAEEQRLERLRLVHAQRTTGLGCILARTQNVSQIPKLLSSKLFPFLEKSEVSPEARRHMLTALIRSVHILWEFPEKYDHDESQPLIGSTLGVCRFYLSVERDGLRPIARFRFLMAIQSPYNEKWIEGSLLFLLPHANQDYLPVCSLLNGMKKKME